MVPRGPSSESRGGSAAAAPEAACSLCDRRHPRRRLVHARSIRPGIARFLAEKYPERWKPGALVCPDCLNRERLESLLRKLAADRGELSAIESEVARKAVEHMAIAESIEEEFRRSSTLGQRLADRVARVGGSWPFVIGFLVLLLVHIVGMNTVASLQRWSAASLEASESDDEARHAARRRFAIYRLTVRLASLTAAAILAAWLWQHHA